MADQPRPTLKTIAQLTGLAVPTVSRALSGAADIGVATRQRVRKVADEIGYVPNRAGVRLRTGRTHVISLVLSTESDVMNLTARLIASIAAELRPTSYHLTITTYFPDDDPMLPIEHVLDTGAADAVILNQTEPQDPRIRFLLDKGFPFAAHGRSDWQNEHAYYDFDNRAFGALAVRELVSRGRKNIRVLAPLRHQNYAQEMIAGVMEGAQGLGVDVQVIAGMTSDDNSEFIETQIAALLAKEPEIDGLICGSSNACMGSVSGVEAVGKTVGDSIDLFSKEAIPFLKRFRQGILTQSEDVWSAGSFLARAAIGRIENAQEAPMQFIEVPVFEK